jgi:3-methyladenine DNA glycosylase AlkD
VASPELADLRDVLAANANRENANNMRKYMRDQFAFYGIKAGPLRVLSKEFVRAQKDLSAVLPLWACSQRECQQIAIDIVRRQVKRRPAEDIELAYEIITQKSWWDTVDTLAVHYVGTLCRNHPQLIRSHIIPWSTNPDFWLRRTAILFQLKYKEALDTNLLTQIILANVDSDEFFIQKSIGWVLREYSRTDAGFVHRFVEEHDLPALSRREALRHL